MRYAVRTASFMYKDAEELRFEVRTVPIDYVRGINFDDSSIDCPAVARTLFEDYGIYVPLVSGEHRLDIMPGDTLYAFTSKDGKQLWSPDVKLGKDVEIVVKEYTICSL